jgi:hypothetical protein
MAQKMINIMHQAGMKLYDSNGSTYSGAIDFNHLIQIGNLISTPPRNISRILNLVGLFDRNLMSRLLSSIFEVTLECFQVHWGFKGDHHC